MWPIGGMRFRLEYSEKFSDRQDQKEHSTIKGQKLHTPHQFLVPLPYLQKMDNITWREKNPAAASYNPAYLSVPKKKWLNTSLVQIITSLKSMPISHCPEVNWAVFWCGRITVGVVPVLLKHFPIQTHWHEQKVSYWLPLHLNQPPHLLLWWKGTGRKSFPLPIWATWFALTIKAT